MHFGIGYDLRTLPIGIHRGLYTINELRTAFARLHASRQRRCQLLPRRVVDLLYTCKAVLHQMLRQACVLYGRNAVGLRGHLASCTKGIFPDRPQNSPQRRILRVPVEQRLRNLLRCCPKILFGSGGQRCQQIVIPMIVRLPSIQCLHNRVALFLHVALHHRRALSAQPHLFPRHTLLYALPVVPGKTLCVPFLFLVLL